MAITHPTGFPLGLNGDKLSTPAPPTVTFPHSYANVGDLGVLGVLVPNSIAPSAITGTNSGSWTRRARINDTTNNVTVDIWTATVTSTSGADVVTPTYGGTTTGQFGDFWMDSLTAGFGTSTVWSFPASNAAANGANVTMQYPSLVAATTTNSQAYWGVAGSGSNAQGGTTSGFSYVDSTSNSGNEQIYNLSLTSGTTYAPTSTQDFSVISDVAGLIIQAANGGGGGGGGSVTAAGNFFFALNGGNTSFPPPEVTSLSATSGPAAGGTAVQVNGVFFSGASTVKFGSTSVGFNLTNPQTITTTSPAGTAGATVNVSVTTPSGTSTNAAGNQFTYASGSGGASVLPSVPATTMVPTNIILNENFVNQYNPSAPYNGLNLNVWTTSMWGTGYAQTGGSSPPSSSANVTLKSDGLHLTGSSTAQGIAMATVHATKDPATVGTYTGCNFGPPTSTLSVFMEVYGKFNISSGMTSSAWAVADPGAAGYSSWPHVGEIDIIETNMTGTADICFIWQNSNGSINNGPIGPAQPTQPTALSSDELCTVGMLWTTGGVFFFWGGQPVSTDNGTNGNNPPSYTLPCAMGPVLQGAPNGSSKTGDFIVQYCRIWQGPLSAHP